MAAPPVPVPQLTWALCDAQGKRLAEIRERDGGSVTIPLNGIRTAVVNFSIEERAAALAYPLGVILKAWLGERIIFCGPILQPRIASELATPSAGSVEINAIDPGIYLQRAFVQSMPAMDNELQAEIMSRLMEEADASPAEKNNGILGHGIIDGNLNSGNKRRDRNYPDGKNIWEAMEQLSKVNSGPDFELEPLDRDDRTFARLNVYHPDQGSDRTERVRLQYGLGQHTAGDFTFEPDGSEVTNRATVVGQAKKGKRAPAYVAQVKESMRLFGIFERFEAIPDTDRVARLQSRAEALVASRAFPIEWFDVTPAVEIGGAAYGWARDASGAPVQLDGSYGVPPRFAPDGDYWVGDRIRTDARVGEVDLSLDGRITDATIQEIDKAGNVMVDLTLAPLRIHGDVSGFETEVSVRNAY